MLFDRSKLTSRTRATAFLALMLGMASPLCAQTVKPGPGGVVSIRTAGVPLSAVLQAVGEIKPFAKLTLHPEIASTPVTVDVQSVPVRQALIAVLDAAGVDYLLSGSVEGEGFRLAAIPTDGGRGLRNAGASAQASRSEWSETAPAPLQKSKPVVDDAQPESTRDAATSEGESFTAVQFLNAVATQPAVPRTPGRVIQLPFPGRDGAPLSAVVPPNATYAALPGLLPYPALASPTVVPDDPAMRDIYEALVPPKKPGGN